MDLGDLTDVVGGLVADTEDLAGLGDEVGEVADVLGGLEFVASDHHHLDFSLLQSFDCLRNTILQFILDGTHTNHG